MKILRVLFTPFLVLSFMFTLFVATASPVAAHHCFGHSGGAGSEPASGDIQECLDAGACLDTQGQAGNCQDPDTLGESANSLVSTVINVLSWIVGIVAVIMIIIGGFKYIISSGDSANVTSAKNTILYAIIGLVIVAFAQIIVRFVLDKVA